MSPAGHLLKILLDIALESLTHRVLKMKTSSLTYDQIAHLTHSRLQQAFPRPQATQRILPQCRQKMLGIVRTSGLQAWEMNDEAFKGKGVRWGLHCLGFSSRIWAPGTFQLLRLTWGTDLPLRGLGDCTVLLATFLPDRDSESKGRESKDLFFFFFLCVCVHMCVCFQTHGLSLNI